MLGCSLPPCFTIESRKIMVMNFWEMGWKWSHIKNKHIKYSLHTPIRCVSDRDQSQPMSNILIIQHTWIFTVLHQINRKCWNFRDHDPSQCIGHGGIRFGKDEWDGVRCDGEDFDFWETLLRHGGEWSFCGGLSYEQILYYCVALWIVLCRSKIDIRPSLRQRNWRRWYIYLCVVVV